MSLKFENQEHYTEHGGWRKLYMQLKFIYFVVNSNYPVSNIICVFNFYLSLIASNTSSNVFILNHFRKR